MTEEGLLLTDVGLSAEAGNAAKLLRFFGVCWRETTLTEALAQSWGGDGHGSKIRVICSSDTFFRLTAEMEEGSNCLRFWQEHVHSAFVYAGNDSSQVQNLARRITGDDQATLHQVTGDALEWSISDKVPQFCGALSGMRIASSGTAMARALVFDGARGDCTGIISSGFKVAFAKVDYRTVPVYLSTCERIIDIDAALHSRNFDIRHHCLSAVPLVLYIKWAFPQTCWSAPEVNACLVIDDPLLKPRYGFVNYLELLNLMECHKFSTNIAFIPWNWRRSDRRVVGLFKANPDRYSLSIHGCDHTAAEFGGQHRERLEGKARQAIDRMVRHQSRTGIRHDRIMVFPQGVFSETAIDALKRANFAAAVNTEVISADSQPLPIRISDVWEVAVMSYKCFPIFTRRYPWQGLENFAFDMLLGKPCIIVIHHDFCRDRNTHLVDFIKRLNALKCPLSWRSLGEVARRSCRQRESSAGVLETEMYGGELLIQNRSNQLKRFLIRRRESNPSAVKEIRVGAKTMAWKAVENYLAFEIDLNPGESATVEITFHPSSRNGTNNDDVSYRLRTMLRRLLSEFRDNYVTPTKSWLAAFSK